MLFELQKSEKKSNDEYLAQLRGSTSFLEARISSVEKAEIQYRISRELNDYHKPIFIAINNK